jgi:hypothetical protein
MSIRPFFVSRLHKEKNRVGGCNFKTARNDYNRIDGGLLALDKLFTPINADNTNLDGIQVAMYAKSIQLI